MFKKTILLIIIITLLVVSAGCTAANSASDGRLKIVTTLFPHYDFARTIAGDKADVYMLLPPGMESHSYEPSPADILRITGADIFIYTGAEMEPWAKRILDGANMDGVIVVDASNGITLYDATDGHEDEDDEHKHNGVYDPHFWTDPNNAIIMADTILESICTADEANSSLYAENAESLVNDLHELDSEFKSIVENGARDEIIFGGRFAFYYFARQYGLKYESAYDSCSSEAEPGAKRIAELISHIKAEDIPVVYYEELTNPSVAESIARETGAKPLLLHSCHNVSKDDFKAGVTYLGLMRDNAANLKEGLN